MWILPKNLQLSSGAPDTAGFISDLNEQSQICASSLMVRSKASPARTWLQKWKRDSWTQHLSGRILRPSHARTFVTEWTSLWPVTPASHFPQPESDSAQKTLATSGHTSPDQYELFDLDYASLRMSKDTSASDSEKSLESWNQSVTRRRGEYSARLKSAHRTRESGSSSWPSPIASEVRQGFQDRSRGMKGSQESLTTVVVKDAANWPTPAASNNEQPDYRQHAYVDAGFKSKNEYSINLPTAVKGVLKYGQAAPANPSTDGSRQGLWPTITAHTPDMENSGTNGNSGTYLAGAVKQWATPNAFCYQPPENTEQWTKRAEYQQTEKGVNLHKPIQTQVLHEVEKQWRTPSVAEEKNQNTSTQIYLQNQVGATPKAWATPQLQDGHNINQDSTTHKTIPAQLTKMNMAGKLNPRWVETLMGLPVGWVMPSCKSPVTIEQTNFDSSETESSLQQPRELFAF